VELYGVPYKIEEIRILPISTHLILEDSAEALGSSYKGKRCTLEIYVLVTMEENHYHVGEVQLLLHKRVKRKMLFFTQVTENAPLYQNIVSWV
jgi:hypothetical protein